MSINKFLILCTSLLLISCSGASFKNDYDLNFDFAKLRNYSWQMNNEKCPIARNSLIDDRVQYSVDHQLSQKGFTKTEIDKAEFFVSYYYLTRELSEMEKERVNSAFAVYSGVESENINASGGLAIPPGVPQGIPQGVRTGSQIETLVLDITDAASKKLIWRGYAHKRLLDSTPKKTSANFVRVINKILEKFPPPAKN